MKGRETFVSCVNPKIRFALRLPAKILASVTLKGSLPSQAESAALSRKTKRQQLYRHHDHETISGQESRMNQGLHRCMMDGFFASDGPMVGWMNR